MNQSYLFFFFCFIACSLTSCFVAGPVVSHNGPVLYDQDITYQPKPLWSDTVHHAVYLSGSVISGSGLNVNDEMSAGQFNLSLAYTLKNISFAAGGFVGAGSYKNVTIPDSQAFYYHSKSFGISGVRASINYYVHLGRADLRLIGLEGVYSHESGDYADFRSMVLNKRNFVVNTRTDLFTVGESSELAWHARYVPLQYAFRLFLGYTNGGFSTTDYPTSGLTGSFAYFMQLKRSFLTVDLNTRALYLTLGYRF